jgi:2-hydroxy-5-methyl-1-naphthoate 7-hydroxylase
MHLDPLASDHHGEAARLRTRGAVVPVVLPGGVRAFAVTRHEALVELLRHPCVSKNWRNWSALSRGAVPEDWPLTSMVKVSSMVAADVADHRRLRRPVSKALTQHRMRALRPRIVEIAGRLVRDLPDRAGADGTVDLVRHFACPLSMEVICELIGVPAGWRDSFRELIEVRGLIGLGSNLGSAVAEEAWEVEHDRQEILRRLVALRAAEPGDDMTTALLAGAAAAAGGGISPLTAEELADTIWLMLIAGHETTQRLIINAVRALLMHPEQRVLAMAGGDSTWESVVDETLRWDAPVGNFLARYPLEDIPIAGSMIPAGEMVLACYSAVGRDPAQHGHDAHLFDITREQAKHLAFGDGLHACPGATLSRVEATAALSLLFNFYPSLGLAVPPGTLVPLPSLFSNSVRALPVRLGPGTGR